MSHHVLAQFPCRPGQGQAFLDLLLPALADTRAHDGCLHIETYTNQDDPDLVVLWQKWTSREHHQAYMAWRAETGMLQAAAEFMDANDISVIHLDPHD